MLSVALLVAALSLLSRPLPLVGVPAAPQVLALGVNVDLDLVPAAELDDQLNRLQDSGLTTVRQRFAWDHIEPARGRFDWAPWDRIVAAVEAHGLHLVAVLDGSPPWARPASDAANPLAPPQERADFGRFAFALATRYASRIEAYEIWNEPNIAPHWGARFVDPADYAGLLREGTVQIKAADPRASVLTAALAPTLETGGANMSDIDFLDRLLAAGAAGWFDAVAVQAYGFDQPPAAAPAPERLNLRRIELLHDVLLRHGLGAIPVWAMAGGWYAPPASWAGLPAPWPAVTDDEQARYATEAVTLARDRPWLYGWLWGGFLPRQVKDARWGFALVTPAGAARPVLQALITAAHIPDLLLPGRHAPDAPALHYPADWRVTPLAADPGRSPDAALHFRLRGRELAFDLQRGPYWAYLTVAVDGSPANALPRDEQGEAYLVLYDPLAARATVTVARDLASGEHEVVVRAHGGWGQWPLLGISVADTLPGAGSPSPVGLALLIAGLLALLAAWRVGQPLPAAEPRPLSPAGTARPGTIWPLLPDWLRRPAGQVAIGVATAAMATLFAFGRGLPLDILSGAGLACLLLLRPPLVLGLITAILPFFLETKGLLGRQFSLPELFTWLGVLVLIGHHLAAAQWAAWTARPGPSLKPWSHLVGYRPLDGPVLVFVGVAVLATLAASRVGVALYELRVVFIDAALFYFLVSRLASAAGSPAAPGDPPVSGTWVVLDGLAAGAVAVALVGLAQAVLGSDIIRAEGVGRVRAFYGSPNNLALYLERVLPLLVALALWGRGWRRWFYGVSALLVLPALVLTFSRGSLVLALPAALLFVGAVRGGRALWLAVTGVLVAAAATIGALVGRVARFSGLFDVQTGTSFVRVRVWRSALQMALDHPWLGVGPDNFLYAYRTRYVLPGAWQELNLSHPHNIVLDLWTRLGVAGLTAGLWLIVAVARAGWQLYRSLPEGSEAAAVLGLLAGLVAGLAHGLVDNSLFLVDLSYFFFMCAGLFAWQRRPAGVDR